MIEKLYTIYAIQCTVNKNIYIGATRQDLKSRLQTHRAFLRHSKHSNKLL
ncbi:MAG: GIY-YIG nuclease family protein [Clostridia bacterium]|nr:GIY-YIG nuclease family protein [Clostridia bacterium]